MEGDYESFCACDSRCRNVCLWGERPDELGPYVQKLVELDAKYVEKILEYQGYLSTPGMDQKAADIQRVMRELHDELAAYPEIEDKKVSAMNNSLAYVGDADNAGARKL